MTAHLLALCSDANDPLRVGRFWAGVLGWEMADLYATREVDGPTPELPETLPGVGRLTPRQTVHATLLRIRTLIRGLPADHPARIVGEREIARLDQIAYSGEVRGHQAEAGLTPLPSVTPEPASAESVAPEAH